MIYPGVNFTIPHKHTNNSPAVRSKFTSFSYCCSQNAKDVSPFPPVFIPSKVEVNCSNKISTHFEWEPKSLPMNTSIYIHPLTQSPNTSFNYCHNLSAKSQKKRRYLKNNWYSNLVQNSWFLALHRCNILRLKIRVNTN